MMKGCFHDEETFCFPLGSAQGNFALYLRLLRAGRKRKESLRGLQNYFPLLVCVTPRWAGIKYKYRCTSDRRVGKVEASFSFFGREGFPPVNLEALSGLDPQQQETQVLSQRCSHHRESHWPTQGNRTCRETMEETQTDRYTETYSKDNWGGHHLFIYPERLGGVSVDTGSVATSNLSHMAKQQAH